MAGNFAYEQENHLTITTGLGCILAMKATMRQAITSICGIVAVLMTSVNMTCTGTMQISSEAH